MTVDRSFMPKGYFPLRFGSGSFEVTVTGVTIKKSRMIDNRLECRVVFKCYNLTPTLEHRRTGGSVAADLNPGGFQ